MADDDLKEILRGIDTIKVQISGIPLLATTLHEIRESMRGMNQGIRMVRAALNDMAHTSITTGEIEALHEDVNRLRAENEDIRARLTLLENEKNG
jgi:ubiquinone biosynthesis protein UbiJ